MSCTKTNQKQDRRLQNEETLHPTFTTIIFHKSDSKMLNSVLVAHCQDNEFKSVWAEILIDSSQKTRQKQQHRCIVNIHVDKTGRKQPLFTEKVDADLKERCCPVSAFILSQLKNLHRQNHQVTLIPPPRVCFILQREQSCCSSFSDHKEICSIKHTESDKFSPHV